LTKGLKGKRSMEISEIQIVPIKPNNGLIGFVSFVLNNSLYLGSIGIYTRPQGGYRLTYPTKATGTRNINIFHPINKEFAETIEKAVIKKFEEVMNKNDRHNSSTI
jgi:DNA-binding cell septation regulator SpoVG